MSCCGSLCIATARHFDEALAKKDLERYQHAGPDLTTRLLLDSLPVSASQTSTLFDVGVESEPRVSSFSPPVSKARPWWMHRGPTSKWPKSKPSIATSRAG